MIVLAQFLIKTPPYLWQFSSRRTLKACPTCGQTTTSTLFLSHTPYCPYRVLCLPMQAQRIDQLCHYLRTRWRETKTYVVLEMGHHPCHVMMAYMKYYPMEKYRHAGALVEVLLDLEEAKIPTWDVNYLIEWLLAALPLDFQSYSLI